MLFDQGCGAAKDLCALLVQALAISATIKIELAFHRLSGYIIANDWGICDTKILSKFHVAGRSGVSLATISKISIIHSAVIRLSSVTIDLIV
jgi:hypothetical protein